MFKSAINSKDPLEIVETCNKSSAHKQLIAGNQPIGNNRNKVSPNDNIKQNHKGNEQIKTSHLPFNKASENIRVFVDNIVIPKTEDILLLTKEQQLENSRISDPFDCQTAEFSDFQWTPDQQINFRVNFLMNTNDQRNSKILANLGTGRRDSEENIYRCKHCEFNTHSLLLLSLHHENHVESIINCDSQNIGDKSYNVSLDIEDSATVQTSTHILTQQSKTKYEYAFTRYEKWCDEKNLNDISNEKVLLVYFEQLSKFSKSSTLWATYSMLRSVMSLKKNVDISKHRHLNAFLKRKSEGYKPTKPKILTKADVVKFLIEAPNKSCLLLKVVVIIGFSGACKKDEFTNLRVADVKDEGQFIRIVIPNKKTNGDREFFVTPGDLVGLDLVKIIRSYVRLRPPMTDHNRFFVRYCNGQCYRQPVGINAFGRMPKKIAEFLNLSNPEKYTVHCFKSSCAVSLSRQRVITFP